MKKTLFLIVTIITIMSCTEQQRVKNWGGSMKMKLKPNEKLINITWKQEDIWILSEDTIKHRKYFREYSSVGILNGEIEITNN